MKTIDVLGLGCAAVDDLLYVPHYPAEDTKMQVRRRERQCGGLCATALVAAARLGAHAAPTPARWAMTSCPASSGSRLRQEGVDLAHLRQLPDVRPVHSVILVDETRHTRTIVYDVNNAGRAMPDWPPDEVLLAAKVLLVDYYGVEGMVRAAKRRGRRESRSSRTSNGPRPTTCSPSWSSWPITWSCRWILPRPGPADRPAEAALALWTLTGARRWWSPAASRALGTWAAASRQRSAISRPFASTRLTRPAAATCFTGPTRPVWPRGSGCRTGAAGVGHRGHEGHAARRAARHSNPRGSGDIFAGAFGEGWVEEASLPPEAQGRATRTIAGAT